MPRVASVKNTDKAAVEVRSARARNMSASGPAAEAIEPSEIEIVTDGPGFKNKADALAFMNEEVEIIVHAAAEKNAEWIIKLGNGGRDQWVMRNRRQTVKRKYVEVLCNSRQTFFTQEEYLDGNGDKAIRNIQHTGLRYPFTVTRDTDRGIAWLETKLADVY